MMNSSPNSMPPSVPSGFWSDRRHRRPVFGLLCFALFGFLDATYLTIEHYFNKVPPCSVTQGCETVTNGPYSVIFGIPTALLGSLYYLTVILALIFYLDSKHPLIIKTISLFTITGFLFSLWLVYLQLFVIHAICFYCMLSALSSTCLFILGMAVLISHHRFHNEQ